MNNQDMISRSALKDHVSSYAGMFTDELGFAVSMEAVLRGIDFMESVDAVEVVHGEWIISSDGYYPYCSECKNEPKHGEMTNFCPNCGADMRERKGDE